MDRLTRFILLVLVAALVLPVVSHLIFQGVDPRMATGSQWLKFVCVSIMVISLTYVILLFINRLIHDAKHPPTERELMQLKISEGYQLMQEEGWPSLPPPYARLEREYRQRYGENPF